MKRLGYLFIFCFCCWQSLSAHSSGAKEQLAEIAPCPMLEGGEVEILEDFYQEPLFQQSSALEEVSSSSNENFTQQTATVATIEKSDEVSDSAHAIFYREKAEEERTSSMANIDLVDYYQWIATCYDNAAKNKAVARVKESLYWRKRAMCLAKAYEILNEDLKNSLGVDFATLSAYCAQALDLATSKEISLNDYKMTKIECIDAAISCMEEAIDAYQQPNKHIYLSLRLAASRFFKASHQESLDERKRWYAKAERLRLDS